MKAASRFQRMQEAIQLQNVALGAQGTGKGIKEALDSQIKQLRNG